MRKRATDEHSGELPPFLVAASLKDFIPNDLRTLVSNPRRYRDPRGGPIRIGFDATLLPRVCEVWLNARDAKGLTTIQEPVAERAEVLMRGLAHVGVIGLVDEATGYQYERGQEDLRLILEAYISKELLPWTERFPEEFYKQMFRLRGWQFNPIDYKVKGPQGPRYAGKLTRELVYKQLPKGVLEELERRNPNIAKGRRQYHHHRFLSGEIGNSHLEKHVAVVTSLMRVSSTWDEFEHFFNKNFGNQIEMDV